ncbi:MAG: alkaline phosphatase family protein [Chitinophagaceae bacterium]
MNFNLVSLTAVIHFKQLLDFHFTGNFKSYKHFIADAASGNLPAYSFVEPRFFTPHNDQHPSGYDTLIPVDAPGKVGSVWLGEKLIWEEYNAVKNSNGDEQGHGNTWKNTLLIITHDEHGGCYDHVRPGKAPAPDEKNKPAGQYCFKFDRLGVRVPMIMVSAHINANTIINTEHRHTSFLHTMCKKWDLQHLTDRDALANDCTEVFNAEQIRDVSNWPDLPEPIIPEEHYRYDFSDALIGDLEKNILRSVSQWKTGSTAQTEKIKTAGEAMQYLHDMEDKLSGANLNELTYTWILE